MRVARAVAGRSDQHQCRFHTSDEVGGTVRIPYTGPCMSREMVHPKTSGTTVYQQAGRRRLTEIGHP